MPTGMVSRLKDMLVSNMEGYAGMFGMDVGEYVANVYGGKPEEYEDVLLEQAEQSARIYVIMSAFAEYIFCLRKSQIFWLKMPL